MVRYLSAPGLKEGTCQGCGKSSLLIAANLGACLDCIRQQPERVLPHLKAVHAEASDGGSASHRANLQASSQGFAQLFRSWCQTTQLFVDAINDCRGII